ncbi:MAG: hypothetical protein AAF871_02300 [Pseudomonadota bacterium]
MDAILRRMPSNDSLKRGGIRLAAFTAGGVVTLLLAMVLTVSYRGYGFGQEPPVIPQVYTDF